MKTLSVIGNFLKKEIDTPTFKMQLLEDGIPYIFTNNAIVRLIMEKAGVNVVNKLVAITDYNQGIVEFELNENLGGGSFNCEFIVTEGNEVATFPTIGYQSFQINKNLDSNATGETIVPSEYEIVIDRIEAIEGALSTKTSVGHKHTIGDTTNLQTTLDNKSNVGHTHTMQNVEGLVDTFGDHQELINALDIETDDIQTRLGAMENSVKTVTALDQPINTIANANNLVEVVNVQGNTYQNLVSNNYKFGFPDNVKGSYTTTYNTNGARFTVIEQNTYSWWVCCVGEQGLHNMLKPNTKYTLFLEYKSNLNYPMQVSIRESTGANIITNSSKDLYPNKGVAKVIMQTLPEFTISKQIIYLSMYTTDVSKMVANDYIEISNVMLLEGDWTTTDYVPFVQGIQSVDTIEVKSVGKNLFNPDSLSTTGGLNPNTGLPQVSGTGYATDFIPVNLKESSIYISGILNTVSNFVAFYDKDKNYLFRTGGGNTSYRYIHNDLTIDANGFTTTLGLHSNIGYIKFTNYVIVVSEGTVEDIFDNIPNVQIEYGNVATEYEPYQETVLQIPLEQPLMKLPNGVCDTIENGKIIRNIDKIVLNGTEVWYTSEGSADSFPNGRPLTSYFTCQQYQNKFALVPSYTNLICDKLSIQNTYNQDVKAIFESKGVIRVGYDKMTIEEFKNHLATNNITLYYQVLEPIIEEINYNEIIETYPNGHILLNGTILPTVNVEYCVGLTGKVLNLEEELVENRERIFELENNLFTAEDVDEYWH